LARFPLVIDDAGRAALATPVGDLPSAALLDWWAADRGLPAGLRWEPGTRPQFEAGAVPRVERAITVDQTNRSVVVGERVIVKWATTPLVAPHPAPERLRRLVAAGFTEMPAVWFLLQWQTPDYQWVPVATAVDFVPGTEDGWTWCLDEARRALGLAPGSPSRFATQLGGLTARMHLALRDPVGELVAVHGDYHVGQILRDSDGTMFVIDFDGNPTLVATERMAHRPAAYDVAGMLVSLENVGHVLANKYHRDVPDATFAAWTHAVQQEFLAAYRDGAPGLLGDTVLDDSLLEGYIRDQIEREFAYADAHLPQWRYVPEAALRRRGLS
jgi:maltokinase